MSELSNKLVARLEKEGQKTIAFFDSLDPADWEIETYTDGAAWSVTEVLTHIVESEKSLGQLMQSVVTKGVGLPDGFDLKEFNERKVVEAENKDSVILLKNFLERRKVNIKMVANFNEEDLERSGTHPFLGKTEILEMVKMMMIHINLHIRDIRRIIKQDI